MKSVIILEENSGAERVTHGAKEFSTLKLFENS